MAVTVKKKTALIVPPSVRRQAGIKPGARVEFKVSGGIITIVPKLPMAAEEHTVEQRRIIGAQLDEAEKGPFYGPFTAKQATAFLKMTLKARRGTRPQQAR